MADKHKEKECSEECKKCGTVKIEVWCPVCEPSPHPPVTTQQAKTDHPEDFCQECKKQNPVWWIDNDLWNKYVKPKERILCPTCFVRLIISDNAKTEGWEERIEREVRHCGKNVQYEETRHQVNDEAEEALLSIVRQEKDISYEEGEKKGYAEGCSNPNYQDGLEVGYQSALEDAEEALRKLKENFISTNAGEQVVKSADWCLVAITSLKEKGK